MRKALLAAATTMLLVGGVWTLQGFNMIGGSRMSGDPFWATVGCVLFVGGLAVGLIGLRQSGRSTPEAKYRPPPA